MLNDAQWVMLEPLVQACRPKMASIVRRRSCGGVLPFARHASTSGPSASQCATVNIVPSTLMKGQHPQALTGPSCLTDGSLRS